MKFYWGINLFRSKSGRAGVNLTPSGLKAYPRKWLRFGLGPFGASYGNIVPKSKKRKKK